MQVGYPTKMVKNEGYILKDIGVRAGAEHKECQLNIVLLSNYKPITVAPIDVTFPFTSIFPDEFMWAIIIRENSRFG